MFQIRMKRKYFFTVSLASRQSGFGHRKLVLNVRLKDVVERKKDPGCAGIEAGQIV